MDRVGLSADMLPQRVTLRFTDRQIAWLETLGSWYEQAGDPDAARRVYREALDAAPDTAVVTQRLAVMEDKSRFARQIGLDFQSLEVSPAL